MTDTIDVFDSYDVAAGQLLVFKDRSAFVMFAPGDVGSPSVTDEGSVRVISKHGATVYGVHTDPSDTGDSATVQIAEGGKMTVESFQGFGEAIGVSLEYRSNSFDNEGTLRVSCGTTAVGALLSGANEITNTGELMVRGRDVGIGVSAAGGGTFDNSGTIQVNGAKSATGVSLSGGDFSNTGAINVVGQQTVTGVIVGGDAGFFHNDGTITAKVHSGDAWAVYLAQTLVAGAHELDNSGRISGKFAVYEDSGATGLDISLVNTGRIDGVITLGGGDDTVTNQHLLFGAVHLGDGADVYDGIGGRAHGTVYGEGGDDQLTGDAHANVLFGGTGKDVLQGGAGADTLQGGGGSDSISGGAGSDHFVYERTDDSSGVNPDQISDLENRDVIDLSAIDADTTQAGDQAFHQVSSFTGHAGELVLTYLSGDDRTLLLADVDGDGNADMTVEIIGQHTDFANFVL